MGEVPRNGDRSLDLGSMRLFVDRVERSIAILLFSGHIQNRKEIDDLLKCRSASRQRMPNARISCDELDREEDDPEDEE